MQTPNMVLQRFFVALDVPAIHYTHYILLWEWDEELGNKVFARIEVILAIKHVYSNKRLDAELNKTKTLL